MAFRIIRLVFLGIYPKFKLILKTFLKRLNKILIVTALTLSSNAKAYIPDRCDWLDCEAMATGTSERSGLLFFLFLILALYLLWAGSGK